MCSKPQDVQANLKTLSALDQDDVDHLTLRTNEPETLAKNVDDGIPAKKRKRRRRNKRRHPYLNRDRKSNVIKPEAPHNSNQFLIEDQVSTKEIDEKLKQYCDGALCRTRDSSFSMDSDAEFCSSADDEQALWTKDFDDTYEKFQAERFNGMTKNQIIEEFLMLEKRVEVLTKRRIRTNNMESRSLNGDDEISTLNDFDQLVKENAMLKRENMELRNKLQAGNSDSKDSESDSSDSCSSCSSTDDDAKNNSSIVISPEETAPFVDYSQTNGHSPSDMQAV